MSAPSLPPDTQATLLLCGHFAADSAVKPLTLAEYNAVALWLRDRHRRPADLLRPDDLPGGDGVPDPDRLRALLARGVQMALAVERWQRLGLWVVGRGEDRYPARLKRLPRHAPPLLYGAGDIARLDAGGLAVVGSRDVDEGGLA
ncbi:MAG: DNA-processing protein DprA, partial [Gemmataceae bacterium]